MGMSRSARITLLLIIDVIFFWVELIVGYAVGSLALVADSFHMLNDVMSLVVALYAIKLTAQGSTDSRYSYGWHRAEILAALINGVFLLALCFSISLEAIERFFSTPEISNPRLVVIVGSLGLASNIVGLFLFHEHGHSHSHPTPSTPSSSAASQSSPRPANATLEGPPKRKHARSRTESYSSLYGHPAATRASLVQTANNIAYTRSPSPSRTRLSLDTEGMRRNALSTDDIPVIAEADSSENLLASPAIHDSEDTPLLDSDSVDDDYRHHSHGGHSHAGSMNMRALLLHVLGDALGNVGVIATGLVIWLTEWSFKFYFDPVISLVITIIIFSSALPLVRSTSFILLQGVPSTISVEQVRASILNVEGVLSLHELHIWQLSETKIVASVHVLTSRNHDFMPVAVNIRKVLHHHGIHSSTIQPEYHPPRTTIPEEHLKTSADTSCLILCPPDEECTHENACCPPPPVDV
ncbi:hypothetical protein EYR40_004069 [Pleurotus pulmonarius]|nr:hypothetical protein EYR40_004069 [Pleurotus pulmonarius]KAF4606774.1 hypothetical protein EYR38_000829 [Pleurotus pulmonarius]